MSNKFNYIKNNNYNNELSFCGKLVKETHLNINKSFQKTLNDYLYFLHLFPKELPLPQAYKAEDGEIVLEWYFNNKSVVLSISGDGNYGYAMLLNGKYVAGKVDGNINNFITPELYKYLKC